MRLLIADDEPIVCTIFKHHLKQYGSPYIKYDIVNDGKELISKCKEVNPDLIITDIKMPNVTGLEAIEEIRKNNVENISIYILSGYTDFEFVRAALQLGVIDYIPKPVKYVQVEALLYKEEKERYKGLPLKYAYGFADEAVALDISELIQNLANSYSENDKTSYEYFYKEYIEKKKQFNFVIDSAFFASKFKKVEESEQDEVLANIFSGETGEVKDSVLIYRIRSIVDMNYQDSFFGLDTVANKLGYSTQYLSMVFKKCTGMNFSSYLTSVRINHAKKLLEESNLMIKDVAMSCGYSYTNYFIKVFSKIEGYAPAEWRLQTRKL